MRHEISNQHWAVLEPLLPQQKLGPGRKQLDNRKVLNGILYVLKTGCAWADVPRPYGSSTTCWRRLKTWSADGTWERIWRTLLSQLEADQKIDWRRAFLDGTFVPALKGGTLIGKGVRGKGSKVMAVVDGQGLPLGLYLDQAAPHEIRFAAATLATLRVPQRRGRPRTRPQELVADKAYDSAAFRHALRQRGIKPTIPTYTRRARKHPKRGRPIRVGASYAHRWKVERCFAWMDNYRRLIVRYDRTFTHYAAFCYLAFTLWCIKLILK